jgi:hypothetical protein
MTTVIDVASATGPATRRPMGTVPPKPMSHSDMTRPRTESGRWACRTVLSDVMEPK